MEKLDFLKFEPVEPGKTNRFIIRSIGDVIIPEILFRNYKFYNDGDDLIFTTEFCETVDYVFNPKYFFSITGFKIDYLDPTGIIYKSIIFDVKGSNFEKIGDYREDTITTNKLKFIVNKEKIILV